MAIQYWLNNIEDPEFSQQKEWVKGAGVQPHPTVKTVILVAVLLGLSRITEENWKEAFLRLRILDITMGPFRYELEEGEEGPPRERFFTAAEVRRLIGLRTNVSDESKAQWNRNTIKRIRSAQEEFLRGELLREKQEAEAAAAAETEVATAEEEEPPSGELTE